MSFADIWSYTIPTQKQYRISRPEVYDHVAAFYAYKGERKATVEIDWFGPGQFILFVFEEGGLKLDPVCTTPHTIREDILEAVTQVLEN